MAVPFGPLKPPPPSSLMVVGTLAAKKSYFFLICDPLLHNIIYNTIDLKLYLSVTESDLVTYIADQYSFIESAFADLKSFTG